MTGESITDAHERTATKQDDGHTAETRERRISAFVILVVALLEGSYVLNSMDRNLFPVLVPDIKGEYGFSLSEVGLLASIFTLGVGLGGIPAAYLIDRYRTKSIVIASILIFSATTALQTAAAGFLDMAVYRVLSGIGEGVQVAVLFAALAVLFRQRRTLALGTLNFCFGLGGFLGPLVGGLLLAASGAWRLPMWIFAAGGLFFVIILLVVMPADFGRRTTAISEASRSERYVNRNVVALLIVAVVSGFMLFSYVSLYPAYLREFRGLTPSEAGLVSGMFGVGALMGIPAGWLGDRFNQKAVVICSLVGSAISGGLAFGVDGGIVTQIVMTFFAGTFISGFLFTNTQALLQRSMPASRTGLASGLFVTFWFLPATVSGLVFGLIQSTAGWSIAGLITFVGLSAVGLVAMLATDGSRIARERAVVAGH